MSRFISIPVKSGDCFYLEYKEGKKIVSALVDGGMGKVEDQSGKSWQLDLYLKHIGIAFLDVIVVTHNDKDHVFGLKHVIQNTSIFKRFIYLPALWFDRLDDVLASPEVFFFELLDDICKDEVEEENDSELELELELDQEQDHDVIDSFDIEKGSNFFRPLHIYNCPACRKRLIGQRSLTKHQVKKLDEALDALSNILIIYKLALKNRLKVCWFEFDTKDLNRNITSIPRHQPKILLPVNSHQISRPKKKKHRAYYWLTLTMVNRRALVFSHISDNVTVLFSSDSLLDFSLPSMKNLIATVPHHGRKSNDSAIDRITTMFPNNLILIRNSHNSQDGLKMSPKFIAHPGSKYCDVCHSVKRPITNPQMIEFREVRGLWSVVGSPLLCICS